jgi:hypothetical protein
MCKLWPSTSTIWPAGIAGLVYLGGYGLVDRPENGECEEPAIVYKSPRQIQDPSPRLGCVRCESALLAGRCLPLHRVPLAAGAFWSSRPAG